jgi:hypothetical protein
MSEQLICANCGLLNWSQWFRTCSCREPDYRFESQEEYDAFQKAKVTPKVVIVNADATITTGKLNVISGKVVGFDSKTNMVSIEVDEHTIVETKSDFIKQEG